MSAVPPSVVLLRNLVPDLPIRPGDVLPGRVLSREGQMGVLFLAGVRVTAQLPPELAAGMRMRLRAGLAVALSALQLDTEIPEELWSAVAEALVWAHRMDLGALRRAGC